MAHSRLSPSGASRWMKCPASVLMEAGYEDSSNEYSIDGTHTHTLLEMCLKTGNAPANMIGVKLSDHDGEFMVDEERAERVQFALDTIKSFRDEMGPLTTIESEERVDAGLIIGREDISGTCDVKILCAPVIHAVDYKDGVGIVSPETPQLKIYALGALAKYHNPVEGGFLGIKTVRMSIIQPKRRAFGHPGYETIEMSVDELLDWAENYLKPACAATDERDPKFVPGEEQCKWCKHRKDCEARREFALNAAQLDTGMMDFAQQSANTDPKEMSDDKIREILEAAPMIRAFLDDVSEIALTRIKSGHNIEGLKVVRGSGRRAWSYPEDEMEGKLKSMGIPKSAMFVTKLVSPAQVEKLKWEKKKRGSDETEVVKLSDRQLKRIQSDYVKKNEGSLKVVLSSDPGHAIEFSAEHLFQAIEPEKSVETETNASGDVPAWLSL